MSNRRKIGHPQGHGMGNLSTYIEDGGRRRSGAGLRGRNRRGEHQAHRGDECHELVPRIWTGSKVERQSSRDDNGNPFEP